MRKLIAALILAAFLGSAPAPVLAAPNSHQSCKRHKKGKYKFHPYKAKKVKFKKQKTRRG